MKVSLKLLAVALGAGALVLSKKASASGVGPGGKSPAGSGSGNPTAPRPKPATGSDAADAQKASAVFGGILASVSAAIIAIPGVGQAGAPYVAAGDAAVTGLWTSFGPHEKAQVFNGGPDPSVQGSVNGLGHLGAFSGVSASSGARNVANWIRKHLVAFVNKGLAAIGKAISEAAVDVSKAVAAAGKQLEGAAKHAEQQAENAAKSVGKKVSNLFGVSSGFSGVSLGQIARPRRPKGSVKRPKQHDQIRLGHSGPGVVGGPGVDSYVQRVSVLDGFGSAYLSANSVRAGVRADRHSVLVKRRLGRALLRVRGRGPLGH